MIDISEAYEMDDALEAANRLMEQARDAFIDDEVPDAIVYIQAAQVYATLANMQAINRQNRSLDEIIELMTPPPPPPPVEEETPPPVEEETPPAEEVVPCEHAWVQGFGDNIRTCMTCGLQEEVEPITNPGLCDHHWVVDEEQPLRDVCTICGAERALDV